MYADNLRYVWFIISILNHRKQTQTSTRNRAKMGQHNMQWLHLDNSNSNKDCSDSNTWFYSFSQLNKSIPLLIRSSSLTFSQKPLPTENLLSYFSFLASLYLFLCFLFRDVSLPTTTMARWWCFCHTSHACRPYGNRSPLPYIEMPNSPEMVRKYPMKC